MKTVKIRFNYFSEELGWLGMMANKAKLLWNEFFNQAVDEKIRWTLDPKNKQAVSKELINPVLEEAIEEWGENLKDLTLLSFKFPVEKLELLDRAATKLYLVRDVFIRTAVFQKIDRVEDQIADAAVDEVEDDFENNCDLEEDSEPCEKVFEEIENERK